MQVKHLQFFANYIEKELGIVYAESNYFQLQNRLDEIIKITGLKDIEDLANQAKAGINLTYKQLLLDIVTNNETSFFRDSKLFEAFKQDLLPKVAKQAGGQTIKIWSAASSTGQEAYSLAMLGHEAKHIIQNLKFEILGTDISQRALTKARDAKYTQLEIQRGLPTPFMLKYFKSNADTTWTLNHEIKSYVKFDKLNLCHSFSAMDKFNIIFCRNVLIYQKVSSKIEIVNRLREHLLPGGYLILGAGESLIGISQDFTQREFQNAIVYESGRPREKVA